MLTYTNVVFGDILPNESLVRVPMQSDFDLELAIRALEVVGKTLGTFACTRADGGFEERFVGSK
jgi:hypothetical protein